MPHVHLPGPRAGLLRTAVDHVAATDPATLRKPDGTTNASAVARALRTTPGTLYKIVNGQLPLNLEVFTALAVILGSWRSAIEQVSLFDADGEPITVAVCDRECPCNPGRELVAA